MEVIAEISEDILNQFVYSKAILSCETVYIKPTHYVNL